MTQTTEHYLFTEEQLDYWASIFLRLGLERQGIQLDAFLEDPYRYLRLAGVGDLKTSLDIDLLAVIPVQGHA